MKKSIRFRCEEEIKKEKITVEHGIYNGFGVKKMSLPSTQEIRTYLLNFDASIIPLSFLNLEKLLSINEFLKKVPSLYSNNSNKST